MAVKSHKLLSLVGLSLAISFPSISHAASGGPDGYGYYYVDSNTSGGPSYDATVFTNATSGTLLATASNADDTSESIALPFNFSFYGTSYSTLYACSDGYVATTSTCTLTNATLASNTQPMMAPFWDDLDTRGAGEIYTYTTGSSPNRVFNIVFLNNTHYNNTSLYGNISFAVQLYETTNDIVFQYSDVVTENSSSYSYGLSATVGIDGGSTTTYNTQLSYNVATYLTNSLAVRFATNVTPVAEANGPYSTTEGNTATISASGSVATIGSLSYAYDCTNDGTYEVTGSSSSTYDCTYADNGTYTAKVRVTNAVGVTATDTATVTVSNVAPAPITLGWSSGYYNYVYGSLGNYSTLTIYGYEGTSIDAYGTATDVAADTISVAWDWGDGTITNTTNTTNISHAYADEGVYTVDVNFSDEDGGLTNFTTANSYLIYHDIINVAPVISQVPITNGSETSASTFVASASDAGTADILTYTWDFGDGNTATGASATHTYQDADSYTWTLTVTDGDGGSDVETGTINPANVSPTISSVSLPSGSEGTSLNFASVAAAAPYDTLSYSWDFGDGNTGTGANTSHTYSNQGIYTVTLTVTDDDGSFATSTGQVTINNVAPNLGLVSAGSGAEGSNLNFSVASSDPGADTLSYTWNWGDGSSSTTSTNSATHSYDDNGSYVVTVTADDGDGGSDTSVGVSVVSNVNPTIDILNVAATGNEGETLSFAGQGSDVGIADTLSYSWNFGDGQTATGANASHSYVNNGSYNVTLTVTDDDGGSVSQSSTIVIDNVAPVIGTYTDPGSVEEGSSTALVVTASDIGSADTITYTWDFGDGTSATGDSVSHTWADNGLYTITVTATDNSGASDSMSYALTVTNADPSVLALFASDDLEGSLQSLSASIDDPGTQDTFSYTWDFGDGNTATGPTPSHSWADNGSYTVSLMVMDDDGGMASATATVVIDNVDPTITSTASTTASEGVAYSYTATATDPGSDSLTWSVLSGPASLSIDPISGVVSWTPTYADSLSPVIVSLQVSDDDGGLDVQHLSITVTALDSDGDGLSDGYEDSVGLNKNDPTDGVADADADGISNADELVDGTDPFSYDGPSAPIPYAPIGDAFVALLQPSLVVDNANSPRGLVLTYEYEVYTDATMTTLETAGTQVQGSGQTSWTVPVALPDHAAAYWRARASDAYVAGAWTDLQSFNVNTSNNAPTDPIAFAPLSGDLLSSLTPDLTWVTSSDPEGTTVTYDVRVWDETLTTLVTEATGITDDNLDAYGSWTVDTALAEDTTYVWTVRAVDADGLSSAWTFPESFTISTGNAAPSDVAWLSPLDADELSEVSPTLIWSASSDPEGTAVSYRVEADIDAGFSAATGWDLSSNSVDLANAGAALTENVDNYLRVRAIDADGISSNWSVISVFVRGENDAPSVPTLLSPDDAASLTDTTPALSAAESTDAEGDAITYVFKVAQNADLSGLGLNSPELSASAGSVNWDVSGDLSPGTWYWSVQATDALGAESGWSEIRSFVLPDVADTGDTAIDTNVPDDSGDITDDSAPIGDSDTEDTGKGDDGCGCSANGQSSLPLGMVVVAGMLMASRRRRA